MGAAAVDVIAAAFFLNLAAPVSNAENNRQCAAVGVDTFHLDACGKVVDSRTDCGVAGLRRCGFYTAGGAGAYVVRNFTGSGAGGGNRCMDRLGGSGFS